MISIPCSFATVFSLLLFLPSLGRSEALTDFSFAVNRVLRAHPVVGKVSVPLNPTKPTCRIVHLKDWHWVSRQAFRADLDDQSAELLSTKEFSQLYEEHEKNVSLVQDDNKTFIRFLIRRHGLKTVFLESLAPRDAPVMEARVRSLRRLQPQMEQFQKELAALSAERSIEDDTKQFLAKGRALVASFDRDLLRLGAAGGLYLSGELEAIRPAENAEAYDAANPVGTDGAFRLDPKKNKIREEFLAKNLLAAKPFAFIVLGGDHDLSPHLNRFSGGRCQYIIVATKAYHRASQKKATAKQAPSGVGNPK